MICSLKNNIYYVAFSPAKGRVLNGFGSAGHLSTYYTYTCTAYANNQDPLTPSPVLYRLSPLWRSKTGPYRLMSQTVIRFNMFYSYLTVNTEDQFLLKLSTKIAGNGGVLRWRIIGALAFPHLCAIWCYQQLDQMCLSLCVSSNMNRKCLLVQMVHVSLWRCCVRRATVQP